MGVSGATGVRLRAPARGSEVTTSGSSRLFSAPSMAATSRRGANDPSIGAEKARRASLPHAGQVADRGRRADRAGHLEDAVAVAPVLEGGHDQFGVIGTGIPCVTWWGLPADGAGSKSKIRRGM